MQKTLSAQHARLETMALLSSLHDDTLIQCCDLAALTGYSVEIVRQRRLPEMPPPIKVLGRLRWRLGTIRQWIKSQAEVSCELALKQKPGRPPKTAKRPVITTKPEPSGEKLSGHRLATL